MRRGKGTSRSESIGLGLAVLGVLNTEGVELSVADIAEVCECSETAIRDLQERAVRKMRRGLEGLSGETEETLMGGCDDAATVASLRPWKANYHWRRVFPTVEEEMAADLTLNKLKEILNDDFI